MDSTLASRCNLKPFAGLLVVSVEQAVAAPLCSCQLAQGGARVIKIEREGGDFARKYDDVVKGESAYFVWANHGKESLQLDIKNSDDAALLHRILAKADIFIQNLAPGAISRAGFDPEQLRRKYPKLITCDISGYGESGDYRDMKAYDFLVQCESGLVSISGASRAPGRVGVSVCDIGTGMNALIGIQQALRLRDQTGHGSGVKVSLFDTMADWMTVPLMHTIYGDKPPEAVGMHHPSIAPYGSYKTADNQALAIAVQNESEWVRLSQIVLQEPELATDARFNNMVARVENREALDAEINSVFGKHERQKLETRLREAGIAYGGVNTMLDVVRHPQLNRRDVTLESGAKAELVAPPIRFSHDPGEASYASVPALGEHSESIRKEFR